ncbi:SPOR domain-containing protein [Hephaestia sp. GCM10023244]|uniref:SPOR domain-containing protein n=1 Tax=unclassified Hephaestia TaxID=2631281 RepID=UPI0020775172|nr:SPOR domain-containing protein [Hephaestia sp. MAHUQ-44]MCM8730704.1 SPOR domain-containing protein [Hephaestia sp. MAHUQ-44]
MKLSSFVSGIALLAGMSAAMAAPAVAQTTQPADRTASGLAMVAPPTPDADELADQMRTLAKNPKDLDALIRAGELTLLLGDPTAAAVLFSRAEKIAPGNPRMKAGMAATLVRMERPGEALRLFAEAERGGYGVEKFAAERGLAYDLIGAQAYAQRDYRVALNQARDDETVRRYALSLGISGDKDTAIAALDPLLRRQDRAAWRDRAFILAMNGDTDEAEKIAKVMMPGPASEGMRPFFAQLAGLSAVDRAFAVHFGEVRSSPTRLADAKLAPPLPPLGGETAPTRLAAAAPPPVPVPQPVQRSVAEKPEKSQSKPLRPGRTAMAATATQAPPVSTPAAAPLKAPGPNALSPVAPPVAASVRMAANSPISALTPTSVPGPTLPPSPTPTPVTRASTAPVTPVIGGEDSILARIIANISVPASELGVAPMPGRAPAVSAAPATGAPANDADDVAKAQIALDAAAAKAEADRLAAIKVAADRKAERAAKAEADRKAAAKKAAEDKIAADKKAAADKAAAAAKQAAEAKKAKAEPARFWVQVAGGANVSTLARAYAGVVDKAPALLKGKQGWWTPLNATNRVLTGPFKTQAEAQAFVNKLAGAGVSAFSFTSKDGQKVTRLSAK